MYVSKFASVCDLCEFFPFLVSKNIPHPVPFRAVY